MSINPTNTLPHTHTVTSPQHFTDVLANLFRASTSPPAPTATDDPNRQAWYDYHYRDFERIITHNKFSSFSPYFATVTLVVLTGVLLLRLTRQDVRRGWQSRGSDMGVCAVCAVLTWTGGVLVVLLAANVAVAYGAWIALPGSPVDHGLPSHGKFMGSLTTLPATQIKEAQSKEARINEAQDHDDDNPDGSEQDCMICWSSDNTLCALPCAHTACKPCLQAMGTSTTAKSVCPLCRTPLFSNTRERTYIIYQKARMSLYASLLLLYGAAIAYHWRRGERGEVWWDLGSLAPSVFLPTGLTLYRIWNMGEDWWRQAGTRNDAALWDVAGVRWAVASAGFLLAMKWSLVTQMG